jgi:hypothetical protein
VSLSRRHQPRVSRRFGLPDDLALSAVQVSANIFCRCRLQVLVHAIVITVCGCGVTVQPTAVFGRLIMVPILALRAAGEQLGRLSGRLRLDLPARPLYMAAFPRAMKNYPGGLRRRAQVVNMVVLLTVQQLVT